MIDYQELQYKYEKALEYIEYLKQRIEKCEKYLGVETHIKSVPCFTPTDINNPTTKDEYEVIEIPAKRYIVHKSKVDRLKRLIEVGLK